MVDSEDVTMAMCIRCAQFFPAVRARCPYCADLFVRVIKSTDISDTWDVIVTKDDGSGAVQLAHLGGYETASKAWSRGHEFLRHVVEHRKRLQSRPP